MAEPLLRMGSLGIHVIPDVGPQRRRCEKQLLDAGHPLPLPHRCDWVPCRPGTASWFFAVTDAHDQCIGGFAAEAAPSRALPGHLILRIERFGIALPPEARPIAVAALAHASRHQQRVLRLHVEVFTPELAVQQELASLFQAHGFQQARELRSYPRTVAIDLRPAEPEILASFHATARRHIRALEKHPVAVRPIAEECWADRLSALYQETMRRTGGGSQERPWARCIALSRQQPAWSRLVGLFRTDRDGPESLLAFAWGCHHGDHAHYDAAASTRQTDLKLPLAYPLVWDLLCWAKRHGAAWFDFGGITSGTCGSGDALGGISDFKRYFSRNEIEVGAEWVFEPHWIRARVAGALSGLWNRLSYRPGKVSPPR